jgi:hypothetical protein
MVSRLVELLHQIDREKADLTGPVLRHVDLGLESADLHVDPPFDLLVGYQVL